MKELKITPPPPINIVEANRISEIVHSLPELQPYFFLKVLESTAIYSRLAGNPDYLRSCCHTKEEMIWQWLVDNQQRILDDEKQFSDKNNPCPTIGVEIELPRKVLQQRQNSYVPFSRLMDVLGFQENYANRDALIERQYDSYEIAPPPSFSSRNIVRMLSALRTGGFIPTLVNSNKPEDYAEIMDDKLISMHINLGIPEGVRLDDERSKAEFRLFATALPFAYTSALRLSRRKMVNSLYEERKAMKTPKAERKRARRLELKAFEFRKGVSSDVITKVQFLSAAMFSYLSDSNNELSSIWEEAREEVAYYLKRSGICPETLKNTDEVSRILRDTKIRGDLKGTFNHYYDQIRPVIYC